MVGWLKRVNGSSDAQRRFNTLQNFEKPNPLSELSNFCSKRKLKCDFNDCLKVFLRQIFDISCYRPLPPVIGEGHEVNLFKLYIAVRKIVNCGITKDEVCWSIVSNECGFNSKLGASLKLVYVKYLDDFDNWLRKVVSDIKDEKIVLGDTSFDFSSFMMRLESGLRSFVSFDLEKLKKDVDIIEVSDDDTMSNVNDGISLVVELNVDVKNGNAKSKLENRTVIEVSSKNQCADDGVEDLVSKKRKRDCYMGMLNWIRKVALNPCHPSVGSLPQRNTWTHYNTELEWKQILLARETMLLRMNTKYQESIWQSRQQMHPSLYDDQLRSSERLVFGNSGDAKQIDIGPKQQADLPDCLGSNYESDSKWFGTRIWPLERVEQNKISLVERVRIGKGRQESCGCQIQGSYECVCFHIKEKRIKLKLELGSAFYYWKFDRMGEEVALSWTKKEEKIFEKIVKDESSEEHYWDRLFKCFPRKDRESLVSYYLNVFILRMRGEQNRDSELNIASDNEESDIGPVSKRFGRVYDRSLPGSIFDTPKKSRLNGEEHELSVY